MSEAIRSNSVEGIAIIGMAGRFPGARNIEEYWHNLSRGVESITFFPETEGNASRKFARGILDDAEYFDASFFGFTPKEAELTDPQQRIFLECCWEALENAGYHSERFSGDIGLFAGSRMNTYLISNLAASGNLTELDPLQVLLGNDKDFVPMRASYKLNLKGPSINVQTACSTSLVAVCMACRSLMNDECAMALAGGTSIFFPQRKYHPFLQGTIFSQDGHCRAFDANASGTVPGDGAGVVVLKRLADAIADGDTIHAVLRGWAVNNDGATKIGYTAPGIEGQTRVITSALTLAGVDPETITYVETHGTGTPLGDPIEIAALTRAFGPNTAKNFCAIGSVKTNIGHLAAAAGIAGLIKTVLALKHQQIPPSLGFVTPNPEIDFANSPFYVNTGLSEWKRTNHPRRSGLSSFGMGGTNAHVILEEAPETVPSATANPYHLILLSARTLPALESATQNLLAFLEKNPNVPLSDVAYTLQVGRKHFGNRRMLVGCDVSDAVRCLKERRFDASVAELHIDALVGRWLAGESVDWSHLYAGEKRKRIPLPTYPFERKRYMIEPSNALEAAVGRASLPVSEKTPILAQIKKLLSDLSGIEVSSLSESSTFMEMGFDSLFLTQVSEEIENQFNVQITFRELVEKYSTPEKVAAYVAPAARTVCNARILRALEPELCPLEAGATNSEPPAVPESLGPFKPLQNTDPGLLTERQRKHLNDLIARYVQRTSASKRITQEYRQVFADPRAVAGFRTLWKEVVYPIVAVRSSGSRIWDTDGNEYVDLTMGFGVNLFGHSPSFITDALTEQLKHGVEIGPQSEIAGRVAKWICEFTGMERATFCNTGSEAVMAALRIARTVTGRSRVAMFKHSYHGVFDEVLIRASPANGKPRPIAPGIPQHMVEDVLMLEYDSAAALATLERESSRLAAVLVEPVQSRLPNVRPQSFLKNLRKLTEKTGTALIFDELITGFRFHPGGSQALFDVRADLATYGKVIGGGMPIGVVAGKAIYMDALDGGAWNYGDDSAPHANLTFFAGTFVRHPLALAAASAVLIHLKEKGPMLQEQLNRKTSQFVASLNDFLRESQAPLNVEHFGSLFNFRFDKEFQYASIFCVHMREKGVHLLEGRPCFLSTAHTDEDLEIVTAAVRETIIQMQQGGFLPEANVIPFSREHGSFPLTEQQKEIWMLSQLSDDASRCFNLHFGLQMRGSLNVAALVKATQALIDRHESLRTTFDRFGEYQSVSEKCKIEVPLMDLTQLDEIERTGRLGEILANEDHQCFDLVNGPLLRAKVIKLDALYHVLDLAVHHIICDGMSYGVLLQELSELYSSECQARASSLPPVMQFKEYARLQTERWEGPKGNMDLTFWRQEIAEQVPPLKLPEDRPRPEFKTYNGFRLTTAFPDSIYVNLKQSSVKNGCTLYCMLLAGFRAFLHRLTRQNDLILGMAIAGQPKGGVSLLGHCVSLLPFRSQILNDPTVEELVTETRAQILTASEHQDCTIGKLLSRLTLPRNPGRAPLIEITFNKDPSVRDVPFSGLEVEIQKNPKRYYNFDAGFNFVESKTGLQLELDFNTDLFDLATANFWNERLQTLLNHLCTDSGKRLSELSWSTPALSESALLLDVSYEQIERILTDIWKQVLGKKEIGPDSNFVNEGGDLAQAAMVISRIRDQFHLQLPYKTLFEKPSLAELASSVCSYLK